jgi:hypothetical protein
MSDQQLSFEERKQSWLDISVIDEAEFDARQKMQAERQTRVPQPGDMAPDFKISVLGRDRKLTGNTVQLSSLRGKPVALMFGSYT